MYVYWYISGYYLSLSSVAVDRIRCQHVSSSLTCHFLHLTWYVCTYMNSMSPTVTVTVTVVNDIQTNKVHVDERRWGCVSTLLIVVDHFHSAPHAYDSHIHTSVTVTAYANKQVWVVYGITMMTCMSNDSEGSTTCDATAARIYMPRHMSCDVRLILINQTLPILHIYYDSHVYATVTVTAFAHKHACLVNGINICMTLYWWKMLILIYTMPLSLSLLLHTNMHALCLPSTYAWHCLDEGFWYTTWCYFNDNRPCTHGSEYMWWWCCDTMLQIFSNTHSCCDSVSSSRLHPHTYIFTHNIYIYIYLYCV